MSFQNLLAVLMISAGCQTIQVSDRPVPVESEATFKQMTFFAPDLDPTVLIAKRVAEGRFDRENRSLGMFGVGGRLASVVAAEGVKRTSAAASRTAGTQAVRRAATAAGQADAGAASRQKFTVNELFGALRREKTHMVADAVDPDHAPELRDRSELLGNYKMIGLLTTQPTPRGVAKKLGGKAYGKAREIPKSQWEKMSAVYREKVASGPSPFFSSGWVPPNLRKGGEGLVGKGLDLAADPTAAIVDVNGLLESLGVAVQTAPTPAADRYLTAVGKRGDEVFLLPTDALRGISDADPNQPFFVSMETASHEVIALNTGTRDGFWVFEVIDDNRLAEIWAAEHFPAGVKTEDFDSHFESKVQDLVSELASTRY